MDIQLLQYVANVIALIISLPLLLAFARIVWLVAEMRKDIAATSASLKEFITLTSVKLERYEEDLKKIQLTEAYRKGQQSRND